MFRWSTYERLRQEIIKLPEFEAILNKCQAMERISPKSPPMEIPCGGEGRSGLDVPDLRDWLEGRWFRVRGEGGGNHGEEPWRLFFGLGREGGRGRLIAPPLE